MNVYVDRDLDNTMTMRQGLITQLYCMPLITKYQKIPDFTSI